MDSSSSVDEKKIKKSNNKKSGMVVMATDHVVNPQIWPQMNLPFFGCFFDTFFPTFLLFFLSLFLFSSVCPITVFNGGALTPLQAVHSLVQPYFARFSESHPVVNTA
jgi:hypothetical protein